MINNYSEYTIQNTSLKFAKGELVIFSLNKYLRGNRKGAKPYHCLFIATLEDNKFSLTIHSCASLMYKVNKINKVTNYNIKLLNLDMGLAEFEIEGKIISNINNLKDFIKEVIINLNLKIYE